MRLRRIHPDCVEVQVEETLSSLALAQRAPVQRPYAIANMVATADGRATLKGTSGPIGNEADRRLFHELRTLPDAIMVGSGTLRVERYGRFVRDPEARARRERAGLAPDPLGCVVTRSLRLPVADIPLFGDPDSTIVVFTSADGELPPCPAKVLLERIPEAELTLTAVLERLRSEHGVRLLLCEGGPTILGALLTEGLLDELFLSVAPKLAGGGRGPSTVEGPGLADPLGLDLAWALESEGHLFLRYVTKR